MNIRWLLPEFDLADFERLKKSVNEVAQSPKLQRYYAFLAKTPVYYITAVGGWNIRKTVLAYLFLAIGVIIPPLFLTTIGLFMITLLWSYGQKAFKDTMIRLHIVRRFRAKDQDRIGLLSEPPLGLFANLRRATGIKNIEEYTGMVRRARIVRRVISALMVSFLVTYSVSIPFLFLHFWVATPAWEALLAARVITLSLYGMLIVVGVLLGTETIASFMLESKRPVYVSRDDLKAVTSRSSTE